MSISPISNSVCDCVTEKNGTHLKIVKAVEDEIEIISKRQDCLGENLYEILIGGRRLTAMCKLHGSSEPVFEVFSFTGAKEIIFEPEGAFIKITIKKSKEEQVLYADKKLSKAYTNLPNVIATQEAKLEFIKEARRKFAEEIEREHKELELVVEVFNRHGVAMFCRQLSNNSSSRYSLYWASSMTKFAKVRFPFCDCKEIKINRIDPSLPRGEYRLFPMRIRPAYSLTAFAEDVRFKFTRDKVTDTTKEAVGEAALNGEPAEVISLQENFQEKLKEDLSKEPIHSLRKFLKI